MSGILGLFFRDGRTVQKGMLEAMAKRISHRGAFPPAIWSNASIGLGNLFPPTNSDQQKPTSPITDSTEPLVIVADARLDNRKDLISSIGIECSTQELNDIDIILEAYKKWGENAAERLLGDFAFAIWDGGEKKLYCARDHMGLRPFYFYDAPSVFAFASEVEALKPLPFVPLRINELMIACHIVKYVPDKKTTFYKDIQRLPPAHCMVIRKEASTQKQYWSLDPQRELGHFSDEQHVEAFRTAFFEAVRCRLRNNGPFGCSLSGGLDSSSITCAARNIIQKEGGAPLHTFSFIFPGLPEQQLKKCDERQYMQSVIDMGGVVPHFIEADHLAPITDLGSCTQLGGQPHPGYNMYLHVAAFKLQRELGLNSHLDGLDGDTTVAYGLNYLADLAKGGNFWQLAMHSRQVSEVTGVSQKRIVWNYGFKPLLLEYERIICPNKPRHSNINRISHSGIDKSFIKKIELIDLLNMSSKPGITAREDHFDSITSPLMTYGIEIAGLAASKFTIELRLPFFDKRLIETSYYMLPRLKIKDGWMRWVLRKAMEGVLPPAIQWRKDKSNLSPNLRMRFHDREQDYIQKIANNRFSSLNEYFDARELCGAAGRVLHTPIPSCRDAELLSGAIILGLWLEDNRSETLV